jgi:ABC-type nitrate/sulfonate/bicarbonate transport system permease component
LPIEPARRFVRRPHPELEAYVQLSGISPTTLPTPSCIVVQGFKQREALARDNLAILQATTLDFACSLTAALLFSVLIDFSRPLLRALFPVFSSRKLFQPVRHRPGPSSTP